MEQQLQQGLNQKLSTCTFLFLSNFNFFRDPDADEKDKLQGALSSAIVTEKPNVKCTWNVVSVGATRRREEIERIE